MVVPNGPAAERLGVDVDPLMVVRGVGERVDAGLLDDDGRRRAEPGAGQGTDTVHAQGDGGDGGRFGQGHGGGRT